MKTDTKILIVILGITSLIPLAIGIFCLFYHAKALQFFSLEAYTNDLDKIFFILGGFVLATIVMPVLSIVWLINNKPEGYTLAFIVGFIALLRGILTLINFNSNAIDDLKLGITPIVVGLLIVMATFTASKKNV